VKEIKAIIQPHMLDKVMLALRSLPHFPGVTVSDCHGQGRGRGPGGHYQPGQRDVFFAKQVKLEVFCDDAICEELVEAIRLNSHTGNSGDGIIMVADLPHVVRIRTGEREKDAT
jgi:nitrogen regulatory protein P-II 1